MNVVASRLQYLEPRHREVLATAIHNNAHAFGMPQRDRVALYIAIRMCEFLREGNFEELDEENRYRLCVALRAVAGLPYVLECDPEDGSADHMFEDRLNSALWILRADPDVKCADAAEIFNGFAGDLFKSEEA